MKNWVGIYTKRKIQQKEELKLAAGL